MVRIKRKKNGQVQLTMDEYELKAYFMTSKASLILGTPFYLSAVNVDTKIARFLDGKKD